MSHRTCVGRPSGAPIRRGISAILAVLVAMASVITFAQPAHAATSGITSALLLNGAPVYDGTPVVNEGDVLTLRVQYSEEVGAGTTVEFELGASVDVTGVPPGNEAIASVVQNGNRVLITFEDPWPAGVNQGVFDLNLTVKEVERSSEELITWKIDGIDHRIEVIVRDSGDEFANVSEGYAKGAAPGNLDRFVTVTDGVVSLEPAIAQQELTYTLRVDSPEARSNFTIADQLPAGLSYVPGSFTGQLTTWDANGLNRTSNPFPFAPTVNGGGFTGAVDLPGPSELVITYEATVTDVAAIEANLQAAYDALESGYGQFETFLVNTASFGGTEITRTGSIRLRHNVSNPNPGPNVGAAFGKTANWATKNVETDEDGNLIPPADIVYTLKADLRGWDASNPNKVLGRNVVITDTLPAQASWNTADPTFITAEGITLSAASPVPADAEAFAGDSYVGRYWVDGQRLLVNVGKDRTTNASIAVKAQLETVQGLPQEGSTTIVDAIPHRLRNTASFAYRDGGPHTVSRDVTVLVLPDTEGGLNDADAFDKTGTARDTTIAPGETVTVDYTFTVGAGKGVDARTSTIVDHVDTGIFDLSDLDAVGISGDYHSTALDASHFSLRTDDDGNLVIELSEAGKAVVTDKGADKRFRVQISLTSRPFDGKVTKTITNRATLFGESGEPTYWSDTETEATSYGDEAEVRKRVFDRNTGEWVESLKAHTDGAGSLVQDTYVYRIEFIPHGSYNNVAIIPVEDVLPDAVEFLGFVHEADAVSAADPFPGPVDLGGNLVASHDAAAGTVTIAQKPGTMLDADGAISTYVAVKVTDISAPIVNRIGSTFAEIEPIKSVSVGDYVWVDTDRDGRQGDPADEPGIPGVVLTLVGPDGEAVTDVFGNPVEPTTTDENGWYTFDDLPALTGERTYTVRIDREASEEPLRPYVPTIPGVGDRVHDSSTWEAATEPGDLHDDGDRDPTLDFGFVLKTYAIGDYVWIDTDKDGVQGVDEEPLAGVTVELLQDGEVIDITETDENGRYVFDDLPAGIYQVRFTLTDEQAERYEFTIRDSGDDDAADSDANPADGLTVTITLDDSNEALTGDYEYREIRATQGIDPTWDAGVIVKEPVEPPADEEEEPPAEDPSGALGENASKPGRQVAGARGPLPRTGADIGVGTLVAGFALLAVGGSMVLIGRRRSAIR